MEICHCGQVVNSHASADPPIVFVCLLGLLAQATAEVAKSGERSHEN